MFDLVRELNRRIDGRSLSTADAERGDRVRSATSTTVLGVLPGRATTSSSPELAALLDARARRARRATGPASDRLRDELAARGIAVEDTRDGQRWRRLVEAGRG